MPLRWLWFDSIPPELGLTPDQKKAVRARASLHRKRMPRYRGAHKTYLMHFVPAIAVAFGFYWWWLRRLLQSGPINEWSPFIAGGLGIILNYVAIAWAVHRSNTPFIRKAIRDIGYEICEDCGYWMRGLNADVNKCPECGSLRTPMTKEPPL